jgi:hypothetical protein
MNLKELIESCDWEKVYLYIHLKNAEHAEPSDLEDVRRSYNKTIDELLSNKPTLPYHFKIVVKTELDWFYTHLIENPHEIKVGAAFLLDDEKTLDRSKYEYTDVSFSPIDKSCEEMCGDLSPWSEMLSMPIVNELNLSNEALLGEILWEITFHGFSEKKTKDFWDKI